LIEAAFGYGLPSIQIRSSGELMRIGEIDPRCGTPTNQPVLTRQRAENHTWAPDAATWAAIKEHSRKKPATVTIRGFSDGGMTRAASLG
jgi:hypothetical protein